MPFSQEPFSRLNWISVRNDGDLPVPAWAVVRAVGVDGEGVVRVARPDRDGANDILFCGPTMIPPGKIGIATRALPGRALFQPDFGESPFFDEVWGPATDSWCLRPGKDGFKAMGGVDTSGNSAVFTARANSLVRLVKVISLTKVGSYYPALEYVWDTVAQSGVTANTCWFLDLQEV